MREEKSDLEPSSVRASHNARIRLAGHLGASKRPGDAKTAGRIDSLSIETPQKLGNALKKIEDEHHVALRRDSVLILVNGVEANALDDLDTVIEDDDEVVVVPMFHGG